MATYPPYHFAVWLSLFSLNIAASLLQKMWQLFPYASGLVPRPLLSGHETNMPVDRFGGVKSECLTSLILWSCGNIFFCSCKISVHYTHTRQTQATMNGRVPLHALNNSRWHPGRVNNGCMLPAGSLAQQYCPPVPVY